LDILLSRHECNKKGLRNKPPDTGHKLTRSASGGKKVDKGGKTAKLTALPIFKVIIMEQLSRNPRARLARKLARKAEPTAREIGGKGLFYQFIPVTM
jgi:hypothetical protein